MRPAGTIIKTAPMKGAAVKFLSCLSLLVLSILPLRAEGRLDFPYVAEKGWTGLAIVNASQSPASVRFSGYSAGGELVGSVSRELQPAGQGAYLVSDLFPGTRPAWIRAESASPIVGLWLVGGDSTSGQVAPEAARRLVFAYVTGESELILVNPEANRVGIELKLIDESGKTSLSSSLALGPREQRRLRPATLFAGGDVARSLIWLEAEGPVLGTALVRESGRRAAFLNGVPVQAAAQALVFPFFTDQPGFSTEFRIANLGAERAEVEVKVFDYDNEPKREAKLAIGPRGSKSFSLVGIGGKGYIQLFGTPSARLVAVARLEWLENGGVAFYRGAARDPNWRFPEPARPLVLAHLAQGFGFLTGIGMVIDEWGAHTPKVAAVSTNGKLIQDRLLPSTHLVTLLVREWELKVPSGGAFLVEDLLETVRGETSGYIYIEPTPSPVYAIGFFITEDSLVPIEAQAVPKIGPKPLTEEEEREQALWFLNLHRSLVTTDRGTGVLGKVTIYPPAQDGATKHSNYMLLNFPKNWPAAFTRPDGTVTAHTEVPGFPGYSDEGKLAAETSSIWGGRNPLEALREQARSFFHRQIFMRPEMLTTGLGFVRNGLGYGALIAQEGYGFPGQLQNWDHGIRWVIYPGDGQRLVPRWFCGRCEDPMPLPFLPHGEENVAPAIRVAFFTADPIEHLEIKLLDQSGQELEYYLVRTGPIGIFAKEPFKKEATYRVKIKAIVKGEEIIIESSFTTEPF